ncbi:MAG: hypothetical protein P8X95_18870 [Anaerolineales bacterium]
MCGEAVIESGYGLDDYEFPNGVWVTIGVYLWTDYQDIVPEARRTGYLKDDNDLSSGVTFITSTG